MTGRGGVWFVPEAGSALTTGRAFSGALSLCLPEPDELMIFAVQGHQRALSC